ncbi:hypothetical protein D3C80_2052150 [compost metagenome]
MQRRLGFVLNQFALDQLRIRLTDVDLRCHGRQVFDGQPVGNRVRVFEAQRGPVGRLVFQRIFAEGFSVPVEQVREC